MQSKPICYDDIDSSIEFIKSIGSIAVLDTQEIDNMTSQNNNFYGDIFIKINAYEMLEKADALLKFKIILINGSCDQIFLLKHKDKISEFLDKGGILLVFCAMYINWLDTPYLYIPSQIPIKSRMIHTCYHQITNGVKDYDITYRRGVCGFFSRGYITPPKNATIILKDSQDKCVAYIDKNSTNGVILHTAGADLFGYGLFEQSTAKRMGLNLIKWLENELKGNNNE